MTVTNTIGTVRVASSNAVAVPLRRALALLRPRSKRPRSRAAEQRDEFAPCEGNWHLKNYPL